MASMEPTRRQACRLAQPASIDTRPLSLVDQPLLFPGTVPASPDVLLRILACGVCRTDLHIIEGELPPHKLPLTPGHQVVGVVEEVASGVTRPQPGDRVGVPWLFSTCGQCVFCRSGQENLCDQAQFTGWDVDGGYASYMLARSDFLVPLPDAFTAQAAAPLLCAGVIGYRAPRLAEVQPGERVGLFGFGASAHLALQVARHWDCRVAVFTRGDRHRRLAEELGADWVGGADDRPAWPLDRAVMFAPAGELVPIALARLRKGGSLAINAIHMSPLPKMDYNLLYGERTLRSVTHATRQDAAEFMTLAGAINIQIEVEPFALTEANQALIRLKRSELNAAAVLVVGDNMGDR